MTSHSTIPAALGALTALWRGWPALSGVEVSDGPYVGTAPQKMITVGYNGDENDQGLTISGQISREGLDGEPNREDYVIPCSTAAIGGGDIAQALIRTTAFDLYNACCDALDPVTGNSTLGGLVLYAIPGDFTVRQVAGTRGRACLVFFSISVSAYTT